jgi:hypothetical protein
VAGAREQTARRSVVPEAAGRSTWLAAIWTGLGAAVVAALIAVVVVAICWLPVAGTHGSTVSALRAGLLTFLAAVHGGVTVAGVSVAWLPLGMPLLVGAIAWRAGSGLADAAHELDEQDPMRLVLAGAAQAATFTVACLVAVPFATLGTSRVPFFGVAIGALVLFAATGGTAFVRGCALRGWVADRVPDWLAPCLRCGAAAVVIYLAAGALLVGGSLLLHRTTVEELSHQVGGGWGGVPVLLLGILAAPNAAIAGASYLAGPGFAVGAGTRFDLFGTAHGTLPAFPVLGAVPTGAGTPVAWGLAAATVLAAGLTVARLALRATRWRSRLGTAVGAAATAGLLLLVLGWQAGGALGDARLRTAGPSPWLLGAAVAAAVAVSSVVMGALVLTARVAGRALGFEDEDDADDSFADLMTPPRRPRMVVAARGEDSGDGDDDEGGELAG